MPDFKHFILGYRNLSSLQMAITIAASWAWGVSIVVGMQVFKDKGIVAFAIWAAANSITLMVFGYLSSMVCKDAIKLADVLPEKLAKPYVLVTYLIQFFSMLVNMTAIKLACSMLGYGGYWWLAISALVFAGVFVGGFSHVSKGNVVKFIMWMVLLVIAIIVSGDEPVIVPSDLGDITWALYGAMILLCAPILDQQMWQRRASFKTIGVMPFAMASVLFGAYMTLVALTAAMGYAGFLVAFIIFLVAGSTLASAVSAVSSFHKEIKTARISMFFAFSAAAASMVLSLSVLQVWVIYGSLRIPFALIAFYVIVFAAKNRRP